MFSTSVLKLVLFFRNDVNILLVFILVSDWDIEMRNSIIEAFEKRNIQKIEKLPAFRSGRSCSGGFLPVGFHYIGGIRVYPALRPSANRFPRHSIRH